jgi:hypothetical protein
MVMKITIPEEVLDEFFRVEPVSCQKYPRRGIPCVSCSDREDCDQVDFKGLEFGDGVMRRAGSSATISVRIPKQGELDELLLRQLVKGMVENQKYMMIAAEETFDVTFFVTVDKYSGGVVTAQKQKKALMRSVLEFLSSKPIEGRLRIHDWAIGEIEKFDHKVRREYKDQWAEIEDIVKSEPSPIEKAIRSVRPPPIVQGMAKPITAEAGANPTESPAAILQFLKEDATAGDAKYAQKFKESEVTGRPIVPRPKAEQPVVDKEYLPRKAAIIEQLPPMPKGNPRTMLEYLESLVQADLPARFISDRIEKAREEIRKTGYWGKAYLEMGSVSRRLYQYHEGLALSLSEKRQVLDKMKDWRKEIQ